MESLIGKVALVTGASRGLGRAIAKALGNAGADVVLTDLLVEGEEINHKEFAQYSSIMSHFNAGQIYTKSTAEDIQKGGSRSLALKMDVSRPVEIENAIREVEKRWGKGIDILVNNAAVMGNFRLLQDQDTQQWDHEIQVNLSGAFYCSRAVWAGMVKKKWGRIINISSIGALIGAFAAPGYGASKAGMIGLTRTLALEGAQIGITVNAVLPGPIETEALKLIKPKNLEGMRKMTAMRRLGRPEEVAVVVVFLASDLASFITGAAIPVTGGAELADF